MAIKDNVQIDSSFVSHQWNFKNGGEAEFTQEESVEAQVNSRAASREERTDFDKKDKLALKSSLLNSFSSYDQVCQALKKSGEFFGKLAQDPDFAKLLQKIYSFYSGQVQMTAREILREAETVFIQISSFSELSAEEKRPLLNACLGLVEVASKNFVFESRYQKKALQLQLKILTELREYQKARHLIENYKLSRVGNVSLSLDSETDLIAENLARPYALELKSQSGQVEVFGRIKYSVEQLKKLQGRIDSLRKQGQAEKADELQLLLEQKYQTCLVALQRLEDRSKSGLENLVLRYDIAELRFQIYHSVHDYTAACVALQAATDIALSMQKHRQNLLQSIGAAPRPEENLTKRLHDYQEELFSKLLLLEASLKGQKRQARSSIDLKEIVALHEALANYEPAREFYATEREDSSPRPEAMSQEYGRWKSELRYAEIHDLFRLAKKLRSNGNLVELDLCYAEIDAKLCDWEANVRSTRYWRDIFKYRIRLFEFKRDEAGLIKYLNTSPYVSESKNAVLKQKILTEKRGKLRDKLDSIAHLQAVIAQVKTEQTAENVKNSARLASPAHAIEREEQVFRESQLHLVQAQIELAQMSMNAVEYIKLFEAQMPEFMQDRLFLSYSELAHTYQEYHHAYELSFQSKHPKRYAHRALALEQMIAIDAVFPETIDLNLFKTEQCPELKKALLFVHAAFSDMSESDQSTIQKSRARLVKGYKDELNSIPTGFNTRVLEDPKFAPFGEVLEKLASSDQLKKAQDPRYLSAFRSALELLQDFEQDQLSAAEQLGYAMLLAETHDNLGQYDEAIQQFRSAQKVAQNLDTKSRDELRGLYLQYAESLKNKLNKTKEAFELASSYHQQIELLNKAQQITRILRDEYLMPEADQILQQIANMLADVKEAKNASEPLAHGMLQDALELRAQGKTSEYHAKLLEIRDLSQNDAVSLPYHNFAKEQIQHTFEQDMSFLEAYVEADRFEDDSYVFQFHKGKVAFTDREKNARINKKNKAVLDLLRQVGPGHSLQERLTKLLQENLSTGEEQPSYPKEHIVYLKNLRRHDSRFYRLLHDYASSISNAAEGDQVARRALLELSESFRSRGVALDPLHQWLENVFAQDLERAMETIPQTEKDFLYRVEHARDRFIQNDREISLALHRMDRVEREKRYGKNGPNGTQLQSMAIEMADRRYQERLRRIAFQKIEEWYQYTRRHPQDPKLDELSMKAWEVYRDSTDCLRELTNLSDATIRHIADEVPYQAALAVVTGSTGNAVRLGILGGRVTWGMRTLSSLRATTVGVETFAGLERNLSFARTFAHTGRWTTDALLSEKLDAWSRGRDYEWANVPFNFFSSAAQYGPGILFEQRYQRLGFSIGQNRAIRADSWSNLWTKTKMLSRYELENTALQLQLSLIVDFSQRVACDELPAGYDEWMQFLGDSALNLIVSDKSERVFNFGLRHFGEGYFNKSLSLEDTADLMQNRLELEAKAYRVLMHDPGWRDKLGDFSNDTVRREVILKQVAGADLQILEQIISTTSFERVFEDIPKQTESPESNYRNASPEYNVSNLPNKKQKQPAKKTDGEVTAVSKALVLRAAEGIDFQQQSIRSGLLIKVSSLESEIGYEHKLLQILQEVFREHADSVGSIRENRIVLDATDLVVDRLPLSDLEDILMALGLKHGIDITLKLRVRSSKGIRVYSHDFGPRAHMSAAMKQAGLFPGRLMGEEHIITYENRDLLELVSDHIKSFRQAITQRQKQGQISEFAISFYNQVFREIEADNQHWEARIEAIEERLQEEGIGISRRKQLRQNLYHIYDAQAILYHRLVELGGEILAPVLRGDEHVNLPRLIDRHDHKIYREREAKKVKDTEKPKLTPHDESLVTKVETEPSSLPEPLPARPDQEINTLLNHDIGFGSALAMRAHQIECANKFRRYLASHQKIHGNDFQNPESPRYQEINHNMLRKRIVMPTGSGKSLESLAIFASMMEAGLFSKARRDMFAIVTDTDLVHGQNLENLQKFAKYYFDQTGQLLTVCSYKGRGSKRKTYYKAQIKDGEFVLKKLSISRGQTEPHAEVVLISAPTAKGDNKFKAFLQQNLGERGRIVGVNIDESHHIENARRIHSKLFSKILYDRNKTRRARYEELRKKKVGNWLKTWAALRSVSPNLIEVTYTATPRESRQLAFYNYTLRQAIQDKVLPRPYVEKYSKGVFSESDFVRVKVKKYTGEDGETYFDFEEKSVTDLLLSHPERNFSAFERVEQHALVAENSTVRGKSRPRSIVAFGRNLKHAHMIAQNYREYCAQSGEGFLQNRQIVVIGDEEGNMNVDLKTYEAIKKAQQTGEVYQGRDVPGVIQKGQHVDGIAFIISGKTDSRKGNRLINQIKKDMDAYRVGKPGPVEAVFGVTKIGEGFDMTEGETLIDLDLTLSRYKKEQRLGRILRRNKKHINSDGTLKKDPPKFFIEPHDQREGLVRIGDFFFMDYESMPADTIMDVRKSRAVGQIDFRGDTNTVMRSVDLSDMPPTRPLLPSSRKTSEENLDSKSSQESSKNKTTKKPKSKDWTRLAEELTAILESDRYDGNIDAMARDLGMDVEYVVGLLEGKYWPRQDMNRLAILLYLDEASQEGLVTQKREVERAGDPDSRLQRDDYKELRDAWMHMQEDATDEGVNLSRNKYTIRYTLNGQAREKSFSTEYGRKIQLQGLERAQWQHALGGLALHFRLVAQRYDNSENEAEMQKGFNALKQLDALLDQAFRYYRWPARKNENSFQNTAESARARLLQMGREALVIYFDGRSGTIDVEGVSQNERTMLSDWLRYEELSPNLDKVQAQIRNYLVAVGEDPKQVDALIARADFAGYYQEMETKANKLIDMKETVDELFQQLNSKSKQTKKSGKRRTVQRSVPVERIERSDAMRIWHKLNQLRRMLDNPKLNGEEKDEIRALLEMAEEMLEQESSQMDDSQSQVASEDSQKAPPKPAAESHQNEDTQTEKNKQIPASELPLSDDESAVSDSGPASVAEATAPKTTSKSPQESKVSPAASAKPLASSPVQDTQISPRQQRERWLRSKRWTVANSTQRPNRAALRKRVVYLILTLDSGSPDSIVENKFGKNNKYIHRFMSGNNPVDKNNNNSYRLILSIAQLLYEAATQSGSDFDSNTFQSDTELLLAFAAEELGWKSLDTNTELGRFFTQFRRSLVLLLGGDLKGVVGDENSADFKEDFKNLFQLIADPESLYRSPQFLRYMAGLYRIYPRILTGLSTRYPMFFSDALSIDALRDKALQDFVPLVSDHASVFLTSEERWAVLEKAEAKLLAQVNRLSKKRSRSTATLLPKRSDRDDISSISNWKASVQSFADNLRPRLVSSSSSNIINHTKNLVAEMLGRNYSSFEEGQSSRSSHGRNRQEELHHSLGVEIVYQAANHVSTGINVESLGESSLVIAHAIQVWADLLTVVRHPDREITPDLAQELFDKYILNLEDFPRDKIGNLVAFYDGPIRKFFALSEDVLQRDLNNKRVDAAIAEISGVLVAPGKLAANSPATPPPKEPRSTSPLAGDARYASLSPEKQKKVDRWFGDAQNSHWKKPNELSSARDRLKYALRLYGVAKFSSLESFMLNEKAVYSQEELNTFSSVRKKRFRRGSLFENIIYDKGRSYSPAIFALPRFHPEFHDSLQKEAQGQIDQNNRGHIIFIYDAFRRLLKNSDCPDADQLVNDVLYEVMAEEYRWPAVTDESPEAVRLLRDIRMLYINRYYRDATSMLEIGNLSPALHRFFETGELVPTQRELVAMLKDPKLLAHRETLIDIARQQGKSNAEIQAELVAYPMQVFYYRKIEELKQAIDPHDQSSLRHRMLHDHRRSAVQQEAEARMSISESWLALATDDAPSASSEKTREQSESSLSFLDVQKKTHADALRASFRVLANQGHPVKFPMEMQMLFGAFLQGRTSLDNIFASQRINKREFFYVMYKNLQELGELQAQQLVFNTARLYISEGDIFSVTAKEASALLGELIVYYQGQSKPSHILSKIEGLKAQFDSSTPPTDPIVQIQALLKELPQGDSHLSLMISGLFFQKNGWKATGEEDANSWHQVLFLARNALSQTKAYDVKSKVYNMQDQASFLTWLLFGDFIDHPGVQVFSYDPHGKPILSSLDNVFSDTVKSIESLGIENIDGKDFSSLVSSAKKSITDKYPDDVAVLPPLVPSVAVSDYPKSLNRVLVAFTGEHVGNSEGKKLDIALSDAALNKIPQSEGQAASWAMTFLGHFINDIQTHGLLNQQNKNIFWKLAKQERNWNKPVPYGSQLLSFARNQLIKLSVGYVPNPAKGVSYDSQKIRAWLDYGIEVFNFQSKEELKSFFNDDVRPFLRHVSSLSHTMRGEALVDDKALKKMVVSEIRDWETRHPELASSTKGKTRKTRRSR